MDLKLQCHGHNKQVLYKLASQSALAVQLNLISQQTPSLFFLKRLC